ncbi:hypothetical protein CORC01_09832 [Colletotrichum orchidophilum]|uniref:Uncharacterized protein n=1 Tax=Colletotrichum orchidophilum TaxID=1209926 RepID=A0A1G4B0P8_9PEZI|nr:uncharacterized protein CORC01_09832 [Colletotrichum orchidophilum]OHE94913.1 hypothetical protein CORC01_09832 [Colletotrichum orchidophilum]
MLSPDSSSDSGVKLESRTCISSCPTASRLFIALLGFS